MSPETRPLSVRCALASAKPLQVSLEPDLPDYPPCEVHLDCTDALLSDLGPALLSLYASFAGPPITRQALVEMAEPQVRFTFDGGPRQLLLDAAMEAYAPLLARASQRLEALF